MWVERAVSPGRGELSCSRGYDMPARQRSDAVPSRRGFGEAVEVAGVLLGARACGVPSSCFGGLPYFCPATAL